MQTGQMPSQSPLEAAEPPAASTVSVPASTSYEFDAEQNRLMATLGSNMTSVGICLIVIGVFGALIGIPR